MSRPARRPRRGLTATEIGWLRQLGDMVRRAPTRRDRALVIRTVVLKKVRDHREAGVSWSAMAVALGVTDATLHRWRRADDAKPVPTTRPWADPPPPIELPWPPRAPHDIAGSTSQTISSRASQSQSQDISSTASAWITTAPTDIRTGSPTPSSGARLVLVVSGDPRPGGNLFGPEAAAIRGSLSGAYVDIREHACVELCELARALDTLRPSVLHVAAHGGFGGLFLSLDGSPLSVGYGGFAETIKRSFRPRLVVLNLCGSYPLSGPLAELVGSVISWPGAVDDEQSRAFAGQLYKALANGRTIGQALTSDCLAVFEQWPGLDRPVLDGDATTLLF